MSSVSEIRKILNKLYEAKELIKCPNCGSIEVFEIPRNILVNLKKANSDDYESDSPTIKGKAFNCSNCGFVWTENFDGDKFNVDDFLKPPR